MTNEGGGAPLNGSRNAITPICVIYRLKLIQEQLQIANNSGNMYNWLIKSNTQEGFMTLQELTQFDGKDGRKAYVAVNGTIYDLTESARWQNGHHEGMHQAGADLTEALQSAPVPHLSNQAPPCTFLRW